MTALVEPARVCCGGVLLTMISCAIELHADDWPQWRGPFRDGVWREEGIVKAIPASGLEVDWRVRIGRGYSGPVVAHGRVFVTDHQFNPEVERVLCFDEATGELLWSHTYPVDYEQMEYGNGPRASPTVHDGHVYTLGTQGDLCCISAESGELLWQKDLAQKYDADLPQYGASVAPLIEDDLLIVCIGGQPEASVIAFDRRTGEERWTTLDDRPAYSAPIVIDRGGVRQLIVWTADSIASLNPASGAVYWQEPWKTTFDPAQVVAMPVLRDDRLLFVMGWSRGSRMYQLNPDTPAATLVWRTRSRPTTTISTPLFIDDDHFCSIENAGLCCLDAGSGEEVWKSTEVAGSSATGTAHLTPNGDQVFLFNQRGHLISARLTTEGYRETGRTLLVEPTAGHRAQGPVAWAHPAYANKHVIARNDRVLVRASLDAGDYLDPDRPDAKLIVKSQDFAESTGANAVLALDFSSDGRTLALGTWSGNVKLLDIATGEETTVSAPSIRNNCCAVRFSPEGKLLAYGGGSEFAQASNNDQSSGRAFLWDLQNQSLRAELKGHTSKVTSAAFSPDGGTLATGSADKTIRLWDTATGETRSVLPGHTDAVWSLAYTPDGSSLVSAGWDRTARVWNPIAPSEPALLQGHEEEILSLAISPDGKFIATGSADWTVRLWNLETREERAVLSGHHGGVYCLAFSPDGQSLASGSGDETVILWDVHSASRRSTLKAHRSGISALAFSPDGARLASADREEAVRVWELSAAE